MFLKKRNNRAKEEDSGSSSTSQENKWCISKGGMEPSQVALSLQLHHGIPRTSSRLSYDPIQRLLAVGTLDGKIKLIGNDHVEGILASESQSRCKFLEFANNQAFIVNITVENDLQIWDIDKQLLSQTHKWHTTVTAFTAVQGSPFMYVGDDSGDISVLQYCKEENKLCQMPYNIPSQATLGSLPTSCKRPPSVIGILPFPETSHTRVLIAYSNSVVVVWGLYDAKTIVVKCLTGGPENQLTDDGIQNPSSEDDEEKDICCLSWADLYGHRLAVGYTDGDIWIWDSKIASTVPLVKLQFCPSKSRSPVLSLRWCSAGEREDPSGLDGYLFVYGGQEFECSENLMVFSLNKSTRSLEPKVDHFNLPLEGVFEDMILLPKAGNTMLDPVAAVLVLTSQGQMHTYDGVSIRKCFSDMVEGSMPSYPEPHVVNPFITNPSVTAMKVVELLEGGKLADIFKKFPHCPKSGLPSVLSGGTVWPITGGQINKPLTEEVNVKTVVITGHADGSVKFWDASNSMISQLLNTSPSFKMDEISKPSSVEVSHLEFCRCNGILVVADSSGVIKIYKLSSEAGGVKCVLIKESEVQDQNFIQDAGLQHVAVLDLYGVTVSSLAIDELTEHVVVTYSNGMVCLFDVPMRRVTFNNVLFLDENKQINALTFGPQSKSFTTSGSDSLCVLPCKPVQCGVLYAVAEDLSMVALTYDYGKSTISGPWQMGTASKPLYMCSIEIGKETDASTVTTTQNLIDKTRPEAQNPEPDPCLCYLLISTQNSVHMYLSSVSDQLVKVTSLKVINLPSTYCYVSKFMSETASSSGLVLLDINGTLQIRSLPDLDVLKQLSLGGIYNLDPKWSESPVIVCGENGLMGLLDARRELLLFSILLTDKDSSRAPGASIDFFDRDLAAAATAAAALKLENYPSRQKSQIQGFLGGVLKDLRGGVLKDIKGKMLKVAKTGKNQTLDARVATNLFELFSSSFIVDTSNRPQLYKGEIEGGTYYDPQLDNREIEGDDDEIDIDDISIEDEDISIIEDTRTPDTTVKGKDKVMGESDRSKLFSDDIYAKPVKRSPEEIKAKYGRRPTGDVRNAAGQARDKLLERGEKLQALGNRTEEMQRGAENFASMASELAKSMEGRKWWQF